MSPSVRHTTAKPPSIEDIVEALKKDMDMVKSNCPEGCLRIENMYWDPRTEEFVWDIEDIEEIRFKLADVVSKTRFDVHTHNYRKITKIGVDDDDKWSSPVWADIVDDAQTHARTPVDLEAAGVEVATSPTSKPA